MQVLASPNFGFLADHDPLLVRLAGLAELYCADDPNTAIIKLRQFAEAMLQLAAARLGVPGRGPSGTQADLIRDLHGQGLLSREVADLFHLVRREGNAAAHELAGSTGQAVHLLKVARELAIWFRRTFDPAPGFSPGPFVPPDRPADPAAALREQVAELRAEVEEQRRRAEVLGFAAELAAELRRTAEQQARAAAGERDTALELAQEVEALLAQERARFAAQAELTRGLALQTPAAVRDDLVQRTVARAGVAAAEIQLSEADTRRIIDRQLLDAGWEADTERLRWSRGTRPQAGRNLAIAEVPTGDGPADYMLFAGLTAVGVVEAKRQTASVSGSLQQSKRYSRAFAPGESVAEGSPWGEYRIPFLFATNGTSRVKQIADRTGVWFLDARRPTNLARPLDGWYTPEGLLALLAQDVEAADRALREHPAEYDWLRDYQQDAVHAVEAAIAGGARTALVAMATGTGKTRMLLGVIYRALKAGRFRRVLFLVDRSALGEQALGVFRSIRPEGFATFADIYEVKELADLRPEPGTRLHVATVQAMVKRVLRSDTPPPVDEYDLVVVDECHRGYVLDREMSDAELTFRSEAEYVSQYRRVVEYFDAVRVGVTATPALHTTQIFGEPVYTYFYRQAVIDGVLADFEPPVRIVTARAEDGITFRAGEAVPVLDVQRGQVDLFHTPDEIQLQVDEFNRSVLTEPFNRALAGELAKHIDPRDPGKTLVFCVDDGHADLMVRLLKDAFAERNGEVEDDAVIKITGSADKPGRLIRRFKNERLPSVAVTVDLLTTGIDVPEIVNLVFVRRVRSRILYEQMLGRATRLRPDLYGPGDDKETFRVFDCVDLFSALDPYSAMHPVAVSPSLSFRQMVDELTTVPDAAAGAVVLGQLVARLRRVRRKLEAAGVEFTALAGCTPKELAGQLEAMEPGEAGAFLGERPDLVELLDRRAGPSARRVFISEHPDEVRRVERGFGDGVGPGEYLEQFGTFVRTHLNEIPALLAVVQRPRSLTRAQLRELKTALDEAGFPEAHLQAAWREMTSQEIAASIIGFVRQRALGSTLEPYDDRVARAVRRILASRPWTPEQRTWLERIGRQLADEKVVDRETMDRGAFRDWGGFARFDRLFGGHLQEVLGDLQDEVWRDAA